MANKFVFRRGTLAGLSAAATANQLLQGEPFYLIDQQRFGIGVTASTYVLYAKLSEVSGGTSIPKGTAVIDFTLQGKDSATVTVLNATVVATSVINVFLSHIGTSTNDADEHFVETTIPKITKIVPGVSFDITMTLEDAGLLFGTWLVNWSII